MGLVIISTMPCGCMITAATEFPMPNLVRNRECTDRHSIEFNEKGEPYILSVGIADDCDMTLIIDNASDYHWDGWPGKSDTDK